MISKFLKLKKNKWLFSLAIIIASVLLFDLFTIVFNVIQILVLPGNRARLSGFFTPLNIIAICLNAVCVLLIVAYLIVRKYSKINM